MEAAAEEEEEDEEEGDVPGGGVGEGQGGGSGARQKGPEIFSHLTVYRGFLLPHHMTDGVVIVAQELDSVHLQNSNRKNHPIFLSPSQEFTVRSSHMTSSLIGVLRP